MLLTELQFLPSLYYFGCVHSCSGLWIEAEENYNKGSFRNRVLFRSNQGSRFYTIPLQQGKNHGLPIRKVQISYDEDWKGNLIKTLQTEYGKYPYFEIYFHDLLPLLETESPHYLYPMSLRLLKWLMNILELNPPHFTTEYQTRPVDHILDYRDHITPAFFRSRSSIMTPQKIGYFEFIPGHTILESLFAYGPETIWLLRRYSKKFIVSLPR